MYLDHTLIFIFLSYLCVFAPLRENILTHAEYDKDREISKAQAKALGELFHVDPGLFI